MNKSKYLLVTLLIAIPFLFFSQEKIEYPKLKTIIECFYKNYGIPKSSYLNEKLEFEKKHEGWFVVAIDKHKDKKKWLFWDAKKDRYIKLKLYNRKKVNNYKEYSEKHLKKYRNTYYDLYPYYGYAGFAKDVIDYYESYQGLMNDTTHYALGRAYDHYANNLIGAYWDYVDSTIIFDLPFGKNSMNNEQLSKYNSYVDKAILNYSKVVELNPKMKVLIGSIKTKLANTYVDNYLHLLRLQNEKEAKKRLKKGNYNKAWIDIATNYLSSCDSNTILITYGDNDTYPLRYVQTMNGHREDVQIINYSLLANQSYFNHVLDFSQKQKRISSSFTQDDLKEKLILSNYHGNNLEVFLLKENEEIISISKIKNYLGKEYLPKNFIFKLKKNKTIKFKSKGDYMLKSDLFLLDMIAYNYSARPICFTSSYIQGSVGKLNKYIETKGYIHQLNFERGDERINKSKSYESLLIKANYRGFNEALQEDRWIHRGIRLNLFLLADKYMKSNKPDTALYILNFSDSILPNERCYYGDLSVSVSDLYIKCNKTNKSKLILNQVLENIQEDKNIFYNPNQRERILKQIIKIAQENEFVKIKQKSVKLLNE